MFSLVGVVDAVVMIGQTSTLLRWRRTWDRHQHAYISLGELVSKALCMHVGRTSSFVNNSAKADQAMTS
ncbi:hypothetical protein BLA60_13465 [Actinophytocola xinjiangensis]|uniref:Uncharacterized protein n=1 Tax=Actinophytocola xinjiangensis TaxID=485602 RepID=A0A7Z0WN91_9PSEU|nr:hypothetical protein [Actinophytocola xinjiangensis]OLF11019.1 hypothetical protein BLA60_13465 [Actinophytocola xinjiangensis]